jgi:Tfp pilus assembly protein PilF
MPTALIKSLAACLLLMGLAACQPQTVAVMPEPQASPQDYYAAGVQAFNVENYNQAATQFDAAIRLAPGMADAYWYLGMCYAKMGMTRRAEETYRSGLAVAPGHLRLHEALGLLSYDLGNYPQARQELSQAASLGSANPLVFTDLGHLALSVGDCPTALASYQRALALDPGFLPARQGLGNAQGSCRARAPRAPTPKVEKGFTGGGRAIDPADF